MTRLNATLLNRAKNHDGVESAWFHNGKVLFKPNGINKTLHVMPYEDLNTIIRRATETAAAVSRDTPAPARAPAPPADDDNQPAGAAQESQDNKA